MKNSLGDQIFNSFGPTAARPERSGGHETPPLGGGADFPFSGAMLRLLLTWAAWGSGVSWWLGGLLIFATVARMHPAPCALFRCCTKLGRVGRTMPVGFFFPLSSRYGYRGSSRPEGERVLGWFRHKCTSDTLGPNSSSHAKVASPCLFHHCPGVGRDPPAAGRPAGTSTSDTAGHLELDGA